MQSSLASILTRTGWVDWELSIAHYGPQVPLEEVEENDWRRLLELRNKARVRRYRRGSTAGHHHGRSEEQNGSKLIALEAVTLFVNFVLENRPQIILQLREELCPGGLKFFEHRSVLSPIPCPAMSFLCSARVKHFETPGMGVY